MMHSIDVGRMPTPPAQAGSPPLTPEQRSGLAKGLANFDPNNLSASHAKDIVSQIKDLGIAPGRGLAAAMADAGFNEREVAQKAAVNKQGSPPPPPPSDAAANSPDIQTSSAVNSEAVEALKRLIEGYAGHDITDDDWTDILTAMDDRGYGLSRTLLDVKL